MKLKDFLRRVSGEDPETEVQTSLFQFSFLEAEKEGFTFENLETTGQAPYSNLDKYVCRETDEIIIREPKGLLVRDYHPHDGIYQRHHKVIYHSFIMKNHPDIITYKIIFYSGFYDLIGVSEFNSRERAEKYYNSLDVRNKLFIKGEIIDRKY